MVRVFLITNSMNVVDDGASAMFAELDEGRGGADV